MERAQRYPPSLSSLDQRARLRTPSPRLSALAVRFPCGVDAAGFGHYDPYEGLTWRERWTSSTPVPSTFKDLVVTLGSVAAYSSAIQPGATAHLLDRAEVMRTKRFIHRRILRALGILKLSATAGQLGHEY